MILNADCSLDFSNLASNIATSHIIAMSGIEITYPMAVDDGTG